MTTEQGKGVPPSPVGALQELRALLQTSNVKGAVAFVEDVLRKEQALEDQADDIEASLSNTRKWILIVGFSVCLAVTVGVCVWMRKSTQFSEVPKFCGTMFLQLSAAVLYLGAIVPQIQLFDKVRARATDGVMTSFLALAMVAVSIGLISRGFSLKTAYQSKTRRSTDHIVAWLGMSVIIIPFALHVYMIYQISKYNDDKTATTASSKRLAHWAWWALLVLYVVLWISMAVFGTRSP